MEEKKTNNHGGRQEKNRRNSFPGNREDGGEVPLVEGGEGLRAVVQTDEKESINARRRQTAQRESTRFKLNLQGRLRRKSESPWEGKRFTLDLTEQLVSHVLVLRLTMRPSVSRRGLSAGMFNAETVTSDLCCCFNKNPAKAIRNAGGHKAHVSTYLRPTRARAHNTRVSLSA